MTARGQGKKQLEALKDQVKLALGMEKGEMPAEAGIVAARKRMSLGRLQRARGGPRTPKKVPKPTGKLKERAVFRYADGSFAIINSSQGRIDGLGLVPVTDDNSLVAINGAVRALNPGKSKTMTFSYGYSDAKRNVTRARRRRGRNGTSSVRAAQGVVRKFATISVPNDASFDDCVAWAKSWKNKPEIVKLGRQQIKLSEAVSKKVVYNNAYGLEI